mmetsp:Transcript_39328/g.125033  ORF Transcript_39328/g.125033 Transcript_39328/m.125033 type:complete len:219 (-) Transcript_39328:542-1198(-)
MQARLLGSQQAQPHHGPRLRCAAPHLPQPRQPHPGCPALQRMWPLPARALLELQFAQAQAVMRRTPALGFPLVTAGPGWRRQDAGGWTSSWRGSQRWTATSSGLATPMRHCRACSRLPRAVQRLPCCCASMMGPRPPSLHRTLNAAWPGSTGRAARRPAPRCVGRCRPAMDSLGAPLATAATPLMPCRRFRVVGLLPGPPPSPPQERLQLPRRWPRRG